MVYYGIVYFWPTNPTSAAEVTARFQKLKEIEHPHLCRALDMHVTDAGYVYSVMETRPKSLEQFLFGQSAGSYQECLSPAQIRILAYQITAGLSHLAELGISHSTLSLRNIVFDPDSSGEQFPHIKLQNWHISHSTRGGALARITIGSPAFFAPEIIASAGDPSSFTQKADSWSLGLILVDLILGPTHRTTRNIRETLTGLLIPQKHDWFTTLPDSLTAAKTPVSITSFILRCLTVSPASRPSPPDLIVDILFSESPLSELINVSASAAKTIISQSEMYALQRLVTGVNPETVLAAHGVRGAAPPIECLPLFVACESDNLLDVPSIVDNEHSKDRRNDGSDGLFQDRVFAFSMNHDFEASLKTGPETRQKNYRVSGRTEWTNFGGGHGSYRKQGGAVSHKDEKALPIKPLVLKEKDGMYQYKRVYLFRRLLKEFSADDSNSADGRKGELWREAAVDIPPLLRGIIWTCLLGINPDVTVEYDFIDKTQTTPADRQLELDIPRCHQYNELLSSQQEGHMKLSRILKAWVITEAANGNVYWQGLDSLLAPFVALNFTNEGRAYVSFKAFTRKYFDGFFAEDNSHVLH
ncbi:hypothetical protein HK100_006319, partial [Physocladia obscura]